MLKVLDTFITSFGKLRPKLSMFLIISFDVYNNPMCTTTHTVIKINLSYAYHLFDLWKTQPALLYPHLLYPVNYGMELIQLIGDWPCIEWHTTKNILRGLVGYQSKAKTASFSCKQREEMFLVLWGWKDCNLAREKAKNVCFCKI